ncbi:hypothetical protein AUJ66_00825 [Candidatus Desantisbacteria bacterium CG1_02_38_46]|uniref:Type II secretion system protein GspG C-terminal domain-containing protein n=3 Tax=unclassified Candidatus Desantisiibacteriota TaxID=3106372 RepID=A0A2H9PCC0_9BACT|nr:MAG: hypothetical protein AUJ66_00825 [Candidatus Desantisbacteria bacterium CG1_02_38_46]PIU51872.1 MAG: hypothetical protein COS91_02180 [Candidatus Desantisbacteria bacterium CG07_land_8_20_14_0_80_39_15]PIZ16827.1 MAG: hypothetical protein COY51_01845 [Candidatus Desantisbacteria bacterium CG_4_10_14_0_8_um_filter_39_17]
MITVNIVGILSAIAMHSSLTYLGRAREKLTKENLRAFRQAINMYNLDTGHYPSKIVDGVYCTVGERGGGTTIFSEGYKYLKKIPHNQMPGEDDVYFSNWVTQFETATTAYYNAAFSQKWDGWFYYYKNEDGEEIGLLVVPRSGNDLEGNPYSGW